MAKIKYSETETISSLIRNAITDTTSSLKSAKGYCVFNNIPSGFAYTNYLQNLSNTIENYNNRANSIYRTAGEIDKSFKLTFDGMSSNKSGLDLSKIDRRERLIK